MDGREHLQGASVTPASGATATDPVCGMQVDPALAAHHASHAGHDFHFCSAGCRTKFVAEPEHYLLPRSRPATAATADAIYTARCTRRSAR